MLYLVDRLTRDVGCYFSVLGIYFAHTTERKILRMKFNEKLIEIRKKQGLSQEELGMELQVSRQTISKWETGKSLPDIVSIIRMSELYDLSLDELLKGDATLLNKIERDMKVAKAENNVIKFAWISIVRKATEKVLFAYKLTQNKVHQSTLRHCI